MKKVKLLFFVCLIVISTGIIAQSTQSYNIRGTVKDEVTLQPLIGALVYVEHYENLSTITNEMGDFFLESLPIGHHRLLVSYLGYISFQSVIEVKSGKELIMTITMKEESTPLDEVIITARVEKSKPVNSLSYASTRIFSVDESNKFAGAVDDPARMVQSFAGVVPSDDGGNYVSIRGNHPSALIYRMEGIDIPNPNHFGDAASSGGGVSILSSQMMGNSDFSTGAFAAEYGNVLGGIFDIKLRKGNFNKTEYTLKAGVLGMEAAIEGPIGKNYKGSYLLNYRYSTLSLLDKLGVDLSGVLNYSDFSYHIHLPVTRSGNFSIFGINGWSNQNIDENLDDLDLDKGALAHKQTLKFLSNMSLNGAKYTTSIGKNGVFNAIVGYSTSKNGYSENVKTLYKDYTYFNKFDFDNKVTKISSTLNFTKKIQASLVLKSGIYYDIMSPQTKYDRYFNDTEFNNLISHKGRTSLLRAYTQIQVAINHKWTSNLGIHYTQFLLNGKRAIEPRGNIQYAINRRSNIVLAYGRHSQIQPLIVYFLKGEEGSLFNKNLDFTKAHHFVLNYNYEINPQTRMMAEAYYQYITDMAVGVSENSKFALVNQLFFFPDFALINEGKGKNLGIELTLERFFHQNWYYILTASVFDSKYKTPISTWLNTRFNSKYTTIATIGKEWALGKNKRNFLSVNIKNAFIGGQWDTPIDRSASQLSKEEIRDENNPFSVRLKNYYKLDIGIKFKRNKQKFTSTLSLDLLNGTNTKNVAGITYDIQNDKIKELEMSPLLPVLSYKIEF